MSRSYKAFSLASGLISLLLPANAMAWAAQVTHATPTIFFILLAVAIFVAWLLYEAIKKKSE
ncbi:hypothetical protein OGH69_11190 [Flavobacterium sp. MFBS3-15]|uniref:hypothetical protein n=1 Tax=Flavobacterium sp. MFBS3-15 TaxID=2989816 RepID=UPI002235DA8C|nr:hypothetical protein [Flavobacterium sp. MFBS3-15]MCW4469533.1 hypothetical protein [Flavobacterium sp. MFBS3-15]